MSEATTAGDPAAGSSRRWRLRTRALELYQPRLMGIINVTPDSFSDGGRFFDPQAAIDHGLKLAAEGADILDVGGESTRPYSETVPADEELRRVLPVVTGLARQTDVPISIDTSKASVAREVIAAGAEIVNDITGFRGDPKLIEVVSNTGAAACAMHIQGTPQTMQDDPTFDDVVAEVMSYLSARRDDLIARGVEYERICLDPGIGFGKRTQHNLELLQNIGRFHGLGCPILVGHSRKGFIGQVLKDPDADRTAGTIGVAIAMTLAGVQILRVHDVAAVRQALTLFQASS